MTAPLIETNKEIGLARVRSGLNQILEHSDITLAQPRIFHLLVELGDRSKQFIPALKMILKAEVIAPSHRLHAAHALASIDASNPKWKRYLQQQARRREHHWRIGAIRYEATFRLEDLAEVKDESRD